ncbi:unnamed protein product [Rhodiola kirilowii]
MKKNFFMCFRATNPRSTKLVFYDGSSRVLRGRKHVAGEIMFEFPDHMVCHADTFFIGHPIPALPISAKLEPNNLYFILPIDKFANRILSASSLSLLQASNNNKPTSPIKFDHEQKPFEFVKGSNGRTLIKVVPEFIVRLITLTEDQGGGKDGTGGGFLCSTPELKKQYEQLVGKEMNWSPKLETISEYKIRFSPCRFIEWAEKE